ncbi:MAG: translation elongation factor 4 [Acidobacteriota bacterium]|jgi:GTP-binding protein LepA|nr:translation elongation factor 4 [Acidobacteriota bacterium]
MKYIRNFSIIAHIDHGKTTLSDRLLDITGAIPERERQEQQLDSMELERERGITIKSHFVRLTYKHSDGETYRLNLIDTPGHIDFTYEVSRSLAACEGALLVIDSTQGVEAQTVANTYLALDNDLALIPVMNKIDLPNTELEKSLDQVENIIGIPREEALLVSAKTGQGVDGIIPAIIERIPPPQGDPGKPLKGLIFDSWFDSYRGVIILVRVLDGRLRKGDRVRFLSNNAVYEVNELGVHTPKPTPLPELSAGEVGYIIGSIKNVSEVKIGDTVTLAKETRVAALPGFKEPQPMVFAGFYPGEGTSHEELREAIEKLVLNDSSLTFEPESSPALGIGFRCGFLGLLHKEIIQERLEREYDLAIVTTAPSVRYRITRTSGEVSEIESPAQLPEPQFIRGIEEPIIEAIVITPAEHLGNVLKLLQSRRGIHKKMDYISDQRIHLTYDLPLAEVLYDFFNKLKSISQGYASFDYEFKQYREAPLIKLDILINGEAVDALAMIVHNDNAYHVGCAVTSRMKKVIPRQLFEVVIQAAIGKRVIARTVVKALRKNVLAKCYGGDITRKMKLLEKQKKGKRRMKRIGKVDIPQEAFLAALEIED